MSAARTGTRRPRDPICPSWCDGHDETFQAWERRSSDGGVERSHAHSFADDIKSVGVGSFDGTAGVEVCRVEDPASGLGAASITLFVEGAVSLTPADARLCAARLIDAAEVAEREQEYTPKLAAPETWRPATPEDPPCSCGGPALVVFLTEDHGPVSSCRR